MKKILSLAVLLMAVVGFTACTNEEYARKMGFTWGEYLGDFYTQYRAVSHELHCDISVHQSELNGLRQMGISFDYLADE